MPLRQTDEEQADFVRALQAVAEQEPLPQAELDSLSMLEGGDLTRFDEAWSTLPAGARARLVRGLRDAAEQRLRLDYSGVNRLALDDKFPRPQIPDLNQFLKPFLRIEPYVVNGRESHVGIDGQTRRDHAQADAANVANGVARQYGEPQRSRSVE